MKKLILIIITVLCAGSLFAQTERTTLVITGSSDITLDTDAAITLLPTDCNNATRINNDADAPTDCNNATRINNDADAIDYTLPTAATGLVVIFYDKAGGVITIDAASGDEICLNGTDLTAGYAIDSPGNAGNFICLMAIDNTHWISLGRSGVWVDGGAD
jgi:hypothetical protein